MERFLLFAGDIYYPDGGWDDLIGTYPSYERAFEHAQTLEPERQHVRWGHIVDSESGTVITVHRGRADGGGSH